VTETFNRQGVGVLGEYIVVLRPMVKMTKSQALTHAAWLVALADEDGEFPKILEAVQDT
jgi:hypothetical protein